MFFNSPGDQLLRVLVQMYPLVLMQCGWTDSPSGPTTPTTRKEMDLWLSAQVIGNSICSGDQSCHWKKITHPAALCVYLLLRVTQPFGSGGGGDLPPAGCLSAAATGGSSDLSFISSTNEFLSAVLIVHTSSLSLLALSHSFLDHNTTVSQQRRI